LQDSSLVKVCQAIGISEATVRDRFKSRGYTRQGKRFIATGDTVNINNTENTGDTNNMDNTKKVNRNNEKSREVKSKANDIKLLENRMNSLEQELEQLKAMILSNTSNTTNTIGTTAMANAEIKTFESDNLVSRNYKIDRAVADKFVKFCKVQKLTNDYKVSDLATNALIEYMDKYKEV